MKGQGFARQVTLETLDKFGSLLRKKQMPRTTGMVWTKAIIGMAPAMIRYFGKPKRCFTANPFVPMSRSPENGNPESYGLRRRKQVPRRMPRKSARRQRSDRRRKKGRSYGARN